MKTYTEQLRAQMLALQSHASFPSNRITKLANQIDEWHNSRPVPERWQPVMLGRIAALFGVSRELAAMGLQYAGWKEKRIGTTSYWQLSIKHNNEDKQS